MHLNINLINKITFIYLLLSLLIFIIGWFNPFFAITSSLALFFITKSILEDNENNQNTFFLEKDYLFIILLIGIVWCYISGLGGWFWQFEDWHIRNAILNDLTNFKYPVIYPDNMSLTYYFGFMLVPANIGKLGLIFNLNTDIANHITYYATFFWTLIGLYLIMIQFVIQTKADKIKSLLAVIIFLMFSGMDIFCFKRPDINTFSLEWHVPYGLWFSNFINFSNVFHISTPIWLLSLLFINLNKNITYWGIIALLTFFYYPVALIALCMYIIPMFFQLFWENRNNLKRFFLKIFDIKNILSILLIFPLIILFYKSNYTSINYSFHFSKPGLLFWKGFLFEVGLYLILIFSMYKKNILYYSTFLSLLLFPMISFYNFFDFSIKSTILPLFILCCMIVNFLLNYKMSNIFINRIVKYLLSILLLFGFLTPYMTIAGMINSHMREPQNVFKNYIKTLCYDVNYSEYNKYNYVGVNYQQYPFWKYVARKVPNIYVKGKNCDE